MSDFFVRNIRENPIEDGINESDFLITINSNKVISTQAEFDLVQKQTQVMIEKDIGSREGLNDILKYLDDKGTIDNIGEVNIEYTTEIGHKMHRYHTHIFIKIKHTTKIHIDTLKLKELAKFYRKIMMILVGCIKKK